ncbi:MAG TPA: NADH-quinone oxidoreductase subunit NuoK [Thermodesulfovibrionales bacterium]|nr:NADH-quinone oxidoreductase subunit NuoK [Thermodesulfovibrionales bacterium]
MIPLHWYLLLSAGVFIVGVAGFLTRRNIIIMFMSIELMLNAVNISLVAFSRYLSDLRGQVLVFFIVAVAAAEAAIGLGIIIALFRNRVTAHVDEANELRG